MYKHKAIHNILFSVIVYLSLWLSFVTVLFIFGFSFSWKRDVSAVTEADKYVTVYRKGLSTFLYICILFNLFLLSSL